MPAKVDRCVKGLEGKINPRTKKPYTKSERFAICTAAAKKSNNTRQICSNLPITDCNRIYNHKDYEVWSITFSDNTKYQVNITIIDNEMSGKIVFALDEDGVAKLTGRTDEARANGKLHDHSFKITAKVDESGQLTFVGTAEKNGKDGHDHDIDVVASEADQLEYDIDTNMESDDGHSHLIHVELKEPMAEPDNDLDSPGSDGVDNSKKNYPNINLSTTRKSDSQVDPRMENGVICFEKGSDRRRNFKGTDLGFCSAFAKKDNKRTGEFKLEKDGRLKQMIFRTGVFVSWQYGVIKSTLRTLKDLKRNFDMGVIGDVIPLNIHHNNELGALGLHDELFITEEEFISVKANGEKIGVPGHALSAFHELTPFGKIELIELRKYFQASAEIFFKFRDQERLPDSEEDDDEMDDDLDPFTDVDEGGKMLVHRNLLGGSAATNVPFIPRMRPFAASADDVQEVFESVIKKYGVDQAQQEIIREINRRGLF